MDNTIFFYIGELLSIVFVAPFISLYILLVLYMNSLVELNDLLISCIFLTVIPLIISIGFSIYYGIEWNYRDREKRLVPLALINISYLILLIYGSVLIVSQEYF